MLLSRGWECLIILGNEKDDLLSLYKYVSFIGMLYAIEENNL